LEGIRLETQLREINGTKILDVSGEIDVYTAPQFKDAVNSIIAGGQKHLVVNMRNVTYIDSSGFGALLSATRRLRPEGGTVNLVQVNGAIDRILRITKLNTVFATYDTIDDALAAMVSSLPDASK
jgi:anti-sigma B factor antagonist